MWGERKMAQLEALSYTLFWCGLAAVAVASLSYALAAWGRRLVIREAATDAGTITLSEWQPLPPAVGRLGTLLSWTGLAFLVGSMATRSAATGHPPYSDMFEYLTAFGTLTTAIYVVFERRYHQRTLGAVAMPLALLCLILARAVFSPRIEPLLPALQNNRLLAIHVAAMVTSYGALTVAFAATVLYLVQTDANRYRFPAAGARARAGRLLGQHRLGALLGLGSERDDGARHLADLCRLPARPQHCGLARPAGRRDRRRRLADDRLQHLRRELLDRGPALIRRQLSGSRPW